MTRACLHEETVPVELAVTGEVVARLCSACGRELPAAWGCGDCEYTDVSTYESAEPVDRVLSSPCARHRGTDE